MRRKVIQLASSTLVVSLPSKWANAYSVKKGSEVIVEECKGIVSIQPVDSIVSQNSIEIDVSGMGKMVRRVFGALFKLGYDIITIKYRDDEAAHVDDAIKERLIGFEIVGKSSGIVTLKNIAPVNTAEFDSVLRRGFLILKQMSSDSHTALSKQNSSLAQSVIALDKELNRCCDFCRRVINIKGFLLSPKIAPLYCLVEQIERLGDSYRDICKLNVTLTDTETALFKAITDYTNLVYDMFYTFNTSLISKFSDASDACAKLSDLSLKSSNNIQLLIILNNIRQTIFDLNGVLLCSKLGNNDK